MDVLPGRTRTLFSISRDVVSLGTPPSSPIFVLLPHLEHVLSSPAGRANAIVFQDLVSGAVHLTPLEDQHLRSRWVARSVRAEARLEILILNHQDEFFAPLTRAFLEKPFFPSPTFVLVAFPRHS